MAITKKQDLADKILRRLGAPLVKVELDPAQVNDAIDYARAKFNKWAVGQSIVERYYTLMLSGGQASYNLPAGVTDVLAYDMRTTGSIHTLFTVENYLYNMGMYEFMFSQGGGDSYTLLSYHIARDFLDTVRRYVFSSYNYMYHKYTNTIDFMPTPPTGGNMTFTISGANYIFDSPGFVLLRCMVYEGTEYDVYGLDWILDYATAQAKLTLGRVRDKFSGFSAVGSNVPLALDGDKLIQEAQAEIEKLELTLRNEEAWDMVGEIVIG